MKPEWLTYAEQIRKEIDQLPAKKSGKNVERQLFSTWRQACDQKRYPGSLGDWEVLMRRLGRTVTVIDKAKKTVYYRTSQAEV